MTTINPAHVSTNQYGEDRNQEATLYVANLDEKVTEPLLWELFIQAGPVVNVHLPKDRITQQHQGYGFVELMSEEDADYCLKIMNNVRLFGMAIKINKAAMDKARPEVDVGAILFIGNLDPMVDEKTLYDTFSAFGVLTTTPTIARDPDTQASKGYGFVSYDNFESSDAAIEAMKGQYLMNKAITVNYAMKKDGKERHGTAAERLLAASAQKTGANIRRGQRGFVDLAQASGMMFAPLPAMPVADAASPAGSAPLPFPPMTMPFPMAGFSPLPPGFRPPPPNWKPNNQ